MTERVPLFQAAATPGEGPGGMGEALPHAALSHARAASCHCWFWHAASCRVAVAGEHAAPGLRPGQVQHAAVADDDAQVAGAREGHVDALPVPEEAAGKGGGAGYYSRETSRTTPSCSAHVWPVREDWLNQVQHGVIRSARWRRGKS